VRVIAGTFKGRRLKTPTWTGLRPTSDKLRETLFNILAPRVRGARVLDGYAGTGALGIEALSRGAKSVTFIEADRRAQDLIATNLAICGVESGYAIIRATAFRAFERLLDQLPLEPFDIVLLDPPYASNNRAAIDAVLAAAGCVLGQGGVLALEHAKKQAVPETAGELIRSRAVVSGSSALSFYEVRKPNEDPKNAVQRAK
jgi:16S rRNA (guanine966-N2)-methyltransferase